MSTLASELGHLKNHVKYPTNKKDLVATCNNMMDVPAADRDWFAKSVPEGNYKNPEEVLKVLLAKA